MAGAERVDGSSSSTVASGVLHKEDFEGRLQGTCPLLGVDEANPRTTWAVLGLRSLDHVTVTGLALVGTCELDARTARGLRPDFLVERFAGATGNKRGDLRHPLAKPLIRTPP